MRARRSTKTTHGTRIGRRLLLLCAALALALAIGIAGASSAPAAPAHSGRDRQAVDGSVVTTAKPMAEDHPAAGDSGSSTVVPLVLAGIVILAAAGPWVPHPSRYVYYRIERRW
jgi:hypothetical protein